MCPSHNPIYHTRPGHVKGQVYWGFCAWGSRALRLQWLKVSGVLGLGVEIIKGLVSFRFEAEGLD